MLDMKISFFPTVDWAWVIGFIIFFGCTPDKYFKCKINSRQHAFWTIFYFQSIVDVIHTQSLYTIDLSNLAHCFCFLLLFFSFSLSFHFIFVHQMFLNNTSILQIVFSILHNTFIKFILVQFLLIISWNCCLITVPFPSHPVIWHSCLTVKLDVYKFIRSSSSGSRRPNNLSNCISYIQIFFSLFTLDIG